jgi:hypothetical protein
MREHVEFDRSYIAEQNAEKSRLHGQHFGYMKYAITKKTITTHKSSSGPLRHITFLPFMAITNMLAHVSLHADFFKWV